MSVSPLMIMWLFGKCPLTRVIVGNGKTGRSCARFFERHGWSYLMVDDVVDEAHVQLLTTDVLLSASEIVVSPGVPLARPELAAARSAGVTIRGDVDLFVDEVIQPVIAVTGTNGKSTVATLIYEMALDAGMTASLIGNIGEPCLDHIDDDVDVHVIEVSSFQLEAVTRLSAEIAVLLNITPDHLDRYATFADYRRTKLSVLEGCKTAVISSDLGAGIDPLESVDNQANLLRFGTSASDDYSIDDGYLTVDGERLLSVSDLCFRGSHNQLNALAALATGDAMGLSRTSMQETLGRFKGLAHRCEWIARIGDADYINDSKATNTGATLAAVAGFEKDITLILGGESKGADLGSFARALPANVTNLVLIGRDAGLLQAAFVHHGAQVICASGLEDAVREAARATAPGAIVLLSPACASFDMFRDYQHRGDEFRRIVLRGQP